MWPTELDLPHLEQHMLILLCDQHRFLVLLVFFVGCLGGGGGSCSSVFRSFYLIVFCMLFWFSFDLLWFYCHDVHYVHCQFIFYLWVCMSFWFDNGMHLMTWVCGYWGISFLPEFSLKIPGLVWNRTNNQASWLCSSHQCFFYESVVPLLQTRYVLLTY